MHQHAFLCVACVKKLLFVQKCLKKTKNKEKDIMINVLEME